MNNSKIDQLIEEHALVTLVQYRKSLLAKLAGAKKNNLGLLVARYEANIAKIDLKLEALNSEFLA